MAKASKTHLDCPSCGHHGCLSIITDKYKDEVYNGFCHSCGKTLYNVDPQTAEKLGDTPEVQRAEGLLEIDRYVPLTSRGISLETCRTYDVGISEDNRLVFPYVNQRGHLVAQKSRSKDKDFRWHGNHSAIKLFGQQLFKAGGKRVYVTEGEIDALSVAQAAHSWPSVSVPDGATSSIKTLKANIEFLESFKEIVLVFDSDAAGKKGVEEIAKIITPGKLWYIKWPQGYKDANEVLMDKGSSELWKLLSYNKELYRPDGLISGDDLSLSDLTSDEDVVSFELSNFPGLQEKLRGIRKGELTVLAAGSGLGKSTLAKEIGYDLLESNPELKLGVMALEENKKKTALSFIGLDNNVHFGDIWVDRSILTPEQYQASYDKFFGSKRIWLYDHFGSLESEVLLSKLRYMVIGCGVDVIILDHISIVVSGQENPNERKAIDKLMTDLRSLVEQTGVSVIAVSHVKNPSQGKQHEEGRMVSLSDLRGSGAIKQLSDNVLGLVRDMQENTSNLFILKDRLMADVGLVEKLEFNRETGRLLPKEVLGWK